MTPTFDPLTQLEPVAAVAHSPLALVIAEKVPANRIEQSKLNMQKSPLRRCGFADSLYPARSGLTHSHPTQTPCKGLREKCVASISQQRTKKTA